MISGRVSETLRYDGQRRYVSCGGHEIDCRVRIFQGPHDRVVLLSDLNDSIYSSITLHTEEIAEAVTEEFGLDRRRTLWIEHIPQDRRLGRDRDLYDLVDFTDRSTPYAHPIWTPLDRDEVALLTGESVGVA